MNRPTNIKPLRPSRRMFTSTPEPMRRFVQDWTIAIVGLIAFFVIAHFAS